MFPLTLSGKFVPGKNKTKTAVCLIIITSTHEITQNHVFFLL